MFFSRPSGHKLVDRNWVGDYDFTLEDFIVAGEWTDLDLSAIVPKGSNAVLLSVTAKTSVTIGTLYFRKNGILTSIEANGVSTQIADVLKEQQIIIFCDKDSVIEYFKDELSWTILNVVVYGWFR